MSGPTNEEIVHEYARASAELDIEALASLRHPDWSVAWRSGAVGGAGLVRKGLDAPRRADGTIAGSALTMDRAVANAVDFGVEPALALAAASTWPADLVGDRERGRLAPGARADLVVLDADFAVRSTWIGGREVWSAG